MKRPVRSSILILIGLGLISTTFIDLNNLFSYSGMTPPNYINKDNGPATDDALVTLGRVLFYDTQLSANNTVSCASCHQQAFAFSDPAQQSIGLHGGLTGRHSMRLINARYSDEVRFFWDERAPSLEVQATQPIQDHIEMGFSGANGDPTFNDLIARLDTISYYDELFLFVFGDSVITEARMQNALAQFVRSIQSFDSRYDVGLAAANGNLNAPFNNFTAEENDGKRMFMAPPGANIPGGLTGAGCQGCHRAPEFDIVPNAQNNGIIGVAGNPNAIDLNNTRSPSLRDLVNSSGGSNGPFMHDGSLATLLDVINHYDEIPNDPANTNLDNRLRGGPGPGNQDLNLTQAQKDALVAFLETLSGTNVYTAEQWSNPFDTLGYLDLVLIAGTEILLEDTGITHLYNPTEGNVQIEHTSGDYEVEIQDASGNTYKVIEFCDGFNTVDIAQLPSGLYFLHIQDLLNGASASQTILKQ